MSDRALWHRVVDRLPARPTGADGSRAVFLAVIGLVVGLLVGALVIPKTQDTDIVDTVGERNGSGDSFDGGLADLGEDGSGFTSGDGGSAGSAGSAGRGGGSRSAGTGTGSGSSSGGGGGGAAAAPGPGQSVRGVSETKIRIGVALPDIEAFGNVDEDFNVGDQQAQMEAVLDAWRREGALPVHGRDIEFVYERFDILSSDEQIAACGRFIKDHRVFAVIAGRFFEEGAECVSERFDTPLITVNSADDAFYQRTAPYLFTLRAPWTLLFRNWVAWADVNGHLRGKTIGLFYEGEIKPSIEAGIKQEMARRGYEIAEEVEASGAGIGSSQDQIAVQRFQQAGVDLVMFVGGGTSAINFMTFAESQRYRPDYIDTDYGEHTTDAAAGAYPAAQYDGTPAMTATRVGEVAAGMPLPPETTDCVKDYEDYSGQSVGHRSPETAEYNNIVVTCDLADVLLRGLQAAGRSLHAASLIAGLETIREMPLAAHGNLSFAPGRHWGISYERSIVWRADCTCWVASGQLQPFAL